MKAPSEIKVRIGPQGPELDRCPFPGCLDPEEVDLVVTDGGKDWQAICGGCGMTGPDERTDSKAACSWNLLPRVRA